MHDSQAFMLSLENVVLYRHAQFSSDFVFRLHTKQKKASKIDAVHRSSLDHDDYTAHSLQVRQQLHFG